MIRKNSESLKPNQLSQGLKPRHVQLIALGGTIGTGLFLGSGQAIKFAGPSIVLAYLIAGFACFLLMRAMGELLMSDTSCHSYIYFVSRYLGKTSGFVVGWTYWICWITIAMAEVTAAGLYIKFWYPNFPQWATGLIVLAVLFVLNSVNVSAFGETEFWFAIIKILAIVVLIIAGVAMAMIGFHTSAGHSSFGNLVQYGFLSHGIKGFFLSFQMVIFSFVGIEIIGMTAAETKNPKKEIPRCINSVPMRVLLFYVGSLLALMCIYPWIHISAASSPFVQVFKNLGITSAATIINFVVLTAALSSCNSAIFSTGRMIFSLSFHKKSSLGRKLGTLSKHHVPTYAVGFSTMVIAICLLLNLMNPNGVFNFISSVATTCFLYIWGMIVLTHLRYRYLVQKKRIPKTTNFKLPLYPYSDYFVLAFFAFVAIVLLFKIETLIALIGSVIWIVALYLMKFIQHRYDQKAA